MTTDAKQSELFPKPTTDGLPGAEELAATKSVKELEKMKRSSAVRSVIHMIGAAGFGVFALMAGILLVASIFGLLSEEKSSGTGGYISIIFFCSVIANHCRGKVVEFRHHTKESKRALTMLS